MPTLRCVVEFAQEGFEIGVPADAETVFPPSEDGVARFEFEQGFGPLFGGGGAEARGGDVADVVCEIWVHAARLQGNLELPQRRGGRVVILRRGPLDAVEIFFQIGTLVGEPVAFLDREVAAPVRDFDVALQVRGIDERFCEFVAHARFLARARGYKIVVRAVGEGAALPIWTPAADDVGDVGGGEFELCFLLEGRVGGGSIGTECVEEVLAFGLADFFGEGCEGGEDVVGY